MVLFQSLQQPNSVHLIHYFRRTWEQAPSGLSSGVIPFYPHTEPQRQRKCHCFCLWICMHPPKHLYAFFTFPMRWDDSSYFLHCLLVHLVCKQLLALHFCNTALISELSPLVSYKHPKGKRWYLMFHFIYSIKIKIYHIVSRWTNKTNINKETSSNDWRELSHFVIECCLIHNVLMFLF